MLREREREREREGESMMQTCLPMVLTFYTVQTAERAYLIVMSVICCADYCDKNDHMAITEPKIELKVRFFFL